MKINKIVLIVFIAVLLVVAVVFIVKICSDSSDSYTFADENVSCCKENNVLTLEDAKLITDDCNVLLTNDTFLPKVYKKKNGSVYSVFEIENYGRMYVTYDTADSKNMNILDNVIFVINKSKQDFESLTAGVSTYEDVLALDELTIEMIGGNLDQSVHWLNDGYMLTVKYGTFQMEYSSQIEYNNSHTDNPIVAQVEFEKSDVLKESFFEADLY